MANRNSSPSSCELLLNMSRQMIHRALSVASSEREAFRSQQQIEGISVSLLSRTYACKLSCISFQANLQLEVFSAGKPGILYIKSDNPTELHVSVEVRLDPPSFKAPPTTTITLNGKDDKVSLWKDIPLEFIRTNNFPNITITLTESDGKTKSNDGIDELSSLATDLNNLYVTGLGADFTIICEGKESRTFPVHKSILVGRSEVFAAMLGRHELTESRNETTTIKDIEPGPLNEMLRFLYTDQVENLDLHAADLLMSAEKYNLPKLKSMAEKSLCKTLKLESVIWTAAFAHIHNGQTVVQAATEMIVKHFGEIIKQQQWNDFVKKHPELLIDIHSKLAKKHYPTEDCFVN